MPAVWFCVLALMLTAYAVLDGFDFGAGVVHLFVARTDAERQRILATIGPLWDGNEVWLIASGGLFFFAFPRAYAAAFAGLYLPLMIVLWLLVLRGIAIKVRSMLENPLWRAAWDATFAFASASLAIVLGVALGNIVRGLPLDESGYFQEDLFASSRGAHAGAIDPFTGVFGALALVVLAAHGATFLAWKTTGDLGRRSRKTARWLWSLSLALGALATFVTAIAEPLFFRRIVQRPWLWSLPLSAFASAMVAILSTSSFRPRSGAAGDVPSSFRPPVVDHKEEACSERRELRAFLASCGFIASMLLATAGALYPTILRSTVNAAFTLDVVNAASARSGLVAGLLLLGPALVVAVAYFAYLFRIFRGKTEGHDPHYGE